MGDEPTGTSENCKNTENDKIINVHVSDRLRAREGEFCDQQGTFVQCTSSKKLSAVSTLERVYSIMQIWQ